MSELNEERFEFDKSAISECVGRLECLKNEHNFTLRKLNRCNGRSQETHTEILIKQKMVADSLENVDKALFDARTILNFYTCLEASEIKQKRMELEIQVLQSENIWQKKEMDRLLRSIKQKDDSIIELESKLEQMSFCEQFRSFNLSNYVDSSHLAMNSSSNINEDVKLMDSESVMGETVDEKIYAHNINFNSDEPSRLKTLHGLVVRYVSEKKYEVALPLCKQVIEDLETNRGHYDADVATMLYVIALVYKEKQNYKEAINHLNNSLHIRETIFGRDDLTVASTLNNLSVLYGKTKQLDQAEIMCKKALDIREAVLGPMHADVAKQLSNLALIYQNKKKFSEADKYFTRALSIYENQLGENDPHCIKTRSNIGLLYVKQERYNEALNIYEKILVELYDSEGLFKDQIMNQNVENYSDNNCNMPYNEIGHWHKASKVDKPTIQSIFNYLIISYSKLNKQEKLKLLKQIKHENNPSEKLSTINKLIKLIKDELK